jgi:lysylphosphatidylglycerol synthetase-like protein (DUF2156 family)
MGRRSRKRVGSSASQDPAGRAERPSERAAPPRARPGATSRRARLDEAPKPPWAPVPLTEGTILVGMVLLLLGMVGERSDRALLVGFGLSLVTLASVELSLREHLAGYRSHSSLLAGCAALVVAVPIVLLAPGAAKAVVLVAGAVVYFLVFRLLRDVFRRRSGGMSWRS